MTEEVIHGEATGLQMDERKSSRLEKEELGRERQHRALKRFFRNRLAAAGLFVIIGLVVVAVLAPLIAPYDHWQPHFDAVRAAPSARFLLGTDDMGRDVLSRLIYAGRISVTVGIIAVVIFEVIAVVLGCVSGYFGGAVDVTIQRVVDIVMCFPTMVIILIFIAFLGQSIYHVTIAIALLSWPGPTRLFRGQALQLREMDYVLAARAVGASQGRIIVKHVLPGIVSALVVNATFGVAGAVMTEAGLSFLGLGVQPPTPSWGNMLMGSQNLTKLQTMPWLWLPPGLAIVITVLAINFIGDGLRDALDTKQVM